MLKYDLARSLFAARKSRTARDNDAIYYRLLLNEKALFIRV